MENKKYQIIQSKGVDILEVRVNKALDNGYILCGDLKVTNAQEDIIYTQAIVLGDKNGK